MKVRHLLSLRQVTEGEIKKLYEEAARMKSSRFRRRILSGKTLGLLFLKPSLRTRVSFEVGITQLGGNSLYIGPVELEGGTREAAKDLARVLSRYLDGIVARTFSHEQVQELAQEATIPVINGLSDLEHPCQALGDLFTIQERFGRLRGIRVAYVGDGNNVCHSLMEACALLGLHLSLATPARYRPHEDILRWAQAQGRKLGGRIDLTGDTQEAVRNAQVVYTDVWSSMGQERQGDQRRRDFHGFQVDSRLMRQASPEAVFMHCLPAHRGEEVTEEVMESRRSIVYDQAENRLHVQKAILKWLIKR